MLKETAASLGITVDDTAAERLDIYARLLVEWNEKMNLTAITDPEGIVLKHFVDSLTALPLLPKTPFSLIDVGTGAGFPGLPLAILRDDMQLTLLDSLNKRLIFLEEVCRAVGVSATRIHARAEEGGRNPDLRDAFDVATARAVAGLPVLCELCLPFVKVGGRFLALKGPDAPREKEEAARAVKTLGGRFAEGAAVTLPNLAAEGGTSERHILVVEKTTVTPQKFPRPNAKKAAPL
ncbi:MAG: 16S rRNA (guanine(527)-N(7))-methyltransferase RsmG [Ruminococcaceae bacterium]|nr:16S rRNA (guanine(527)-N(7))-methyltransferase RsmG [Oscillospiraceae bacterium]